MIILPVLFIAFCLLLAKLQFVRVKPQPRRQRQLVNIIDGVVVEVYEIID